MIAASSGRWDSFDPTAAKILRATRAGARCGCNPGLQGTFIEARGVILAPQRGFPPSLVPGSLLPRAGSRASRMARGPTPSDSSYPRRDRGLLHRLTRPAVRILTALRAWRARLRAGGGGDAGENRQGDHGRYDCLHALSPRFRSCDTSSVELAWGIARPRFPGHHRSFPKFAASFRGSFRMPH